MESSIREHRSCLIPAGRSELVRDSSQKGNGHTVRLDAPVRRVIRLTVVAQAENPAGGQLKHGNAPQVKTAASLQVGREVRLQNGVIIHLRNDPALALGQREHLLLSRGKRLGGPP